LTFNVQEYVMNFKVNLSIFSLILITACGPSVQEKEEIAIVACNIMGESLNMNASMRIKDINEAREKIKGKRFLEGDAKIKESFEYGLCEELVMNDADYEIKLYELIEAKNIKLEEERIEAERVKAELREAEREEEYKNRDYYFSVEEKSDRTLYINKWNYPGYPKFKEISTYLKENPLRSCIGEGESFNFKEIFNQKGELISRVTFSEEIRPGGNNCILDGVDIFMSYSYTDPPRPSTLQIGSYKDGRRHGWQKGFYKNGLEVNTLTNSPTCWVDGDYDFNDPNSGNCNNMKEFNYEEIYKSIKGEK